ncbi:uncharacterized protein [Triticum aestivum]|uniref:uncharacterized protein n=1 Tax=Triticum aestivum TaxID=4565 RepID=UPI001D020ACB|nr:uncharacterized protein LOC123059376 [Triticum aestivum]
MTEWSMKNLKTTCPKETEDHNTTAQSSKRGAPYIRNGDEILTVCISQKLILEQITIALQIPKPKFETKHFIGGHHIIDQYASTARIRINYLSMPTGQREICTKKEKRFQCAEEAEEAAAQEMIKTLWKEFNIEVEDGERRRRGRTSKVQRLKRKNRILEQQNKLLMQGWGLTIEKVQTAHELMDAARSSAFQMCCSHGEGDNQELINTLSDIVYAEEKLRLVLSNVPSHSHEQGCTW